MSGRDVNGGGGKVDKVGFLRKGAPLMVAVVLLLSILVGIVSNVWGSGTEMSFGPAELTGAGQRVPQLTGNTRHGEISVAHVRALSEDFYDRFSFSYQEMHTAAWIVEVLLAIGYTWGDIEVQEFTVDSAIGYTELGFMIYLAYFFDSTPFMNLGTRASRQSQNVILTVPGRSDEVIVVGAHYDTVMYPGASDNASGVALLLESAQRMLQIDNYYTITYVFFGAEESGLFGSFYYANSLTRQQHDNILFMINADVLLDGEDLFYMAGYDNNGRPGANRITETWDGIAQSVNARHGTNFEPLPAGVFGPSDQLAFLPWGHTAMFLAGLETFDGWQDIHFDLAIAQMGRVLHSTRDDYHYINERWPGKMEEVMWAFSIFLEELLLASYS